MTGREPGIDNGMILNYVNGERANVTGEPVYEVFNPAFGIKIGSVGDTSRDEVDRAIDCASEAFEKWSRIPVTERIKHLFRLERLLNENADVLAETVTKEHGKTFEESRGEIMRVIENVQAACASTYHLMGKNSSNISAGIDEEMIRVPMGVFSVIAPFNFPIMVPFWFIPYALGLGNTVVMKPSEKVPFTMQKTIDLFERAGFPKGVVNIVNGGSPTVDAILENKKIVGVSFVGSTNVGEKIYDKAVSARKRAQAGMSAKNYELVMPDADLEKTVGNLVSSFFGNAGERCLAGSVLVTLPENHDKVVRAFMEAAGKLRLGYGLDKETTMGPLIRKDHLERVKSYIAGGEKAGAKLILDGRKMRSEKYENGYFLGPSIFDRTDSEMQIIREEIFGPVASVMQVENFDDAIEEINKSQFGNASTIFTSNGNFAHRFVTEVQAGNIGVNIGVAAPIAFYPFGGFKKSFLGDLHGQGGDDHVHFYTEEKIVISRW